VQRLRNYWNVQFCLRAKIEEPLDFSFLFMCKNWGTVGLFISVYVQKLRNRWTFHFCLCAKIKEPLDCSVLLMCKNWGTVGLFISVYVQKLRNRWTVQFCLSAEFKEPLDDSFQLVCLQQSSLSIWSQLVNVTTILLKGITILFYTSDFWNSQIFKFLRINEKKSPPPRNTSHFCFR
jgi:hypothetical protein